MKKIFIANEAVEVSDEVYDVFYKFKREEKKIMRDRKVGKSINSSDGKFKFKPSIEESLDNLNDLGIDFPDYTFISKNELEEELYTLKKAIKTLSDVEHELLIEIYWRKRTFRQIGNDYGISHTATIKRHNKIIEKLRVLFISSGFQINY